MNFRLKVYTLLPHGIRYPLYVGLSKPYSEGIKYEYKGKLHVNISIYHREMFKT